MNPERLTALLEEILQELHAIRWWVTHPQNRKGDVPRPFVPTYGNTYTPPEVEPCRHTKQLGKPCLACGQT
jgi:hypothetical protein